MRTDRRLWMIVLVLLFGLLLAACNASPEPMQKVPTPTIVLPLKPTFTPTPVPTSGPTAVPTATSAPASPTQPPAPTPTPMPPTPVPSPSPTPTPTPYIEVQKNVVNVRTGPGTLYPIMGRLPQGSKAPIVAKDPSGKWWQICCVDGKEAWVAGWVVEARNDTTTVPVAQNIPTPPPTPTPRPTPTPKPTPTPSALYERTWGPQGITSNSPIMTVWVKVADKADNPIPGVTVRIFHGGQVIGEGVSTGVYQYSRPAGMGFSYPANVKIEIPNPPSGEFHIVLVEGGREVIPRIVFYRGSESPGAEYYVVFIRK